MTAREACLSAVHAALQTLDGVAVYRNRGPEVSRLPAVDLRDGGHAVEPTKSGALYRLRVRIVGWVAAATDAAVGPAISDLYGRIRAAVLADPTLGGAALQLFEGELSDPEINIGEGQRPSAAFELTFEILYSGE